MPEYVGSVYALDETNNRAIAIVLWQTESDMEAFPGLVQENPSLAAGIFSMPEREFYDVSIMDRPEGVTAATRVRVNRRKIRPGKLDESVRVFNDSIIPNGNSLIGSERFVGGYTDQEMVPESASLFEKLYMPIVEEIGHHVYVYSCQCPSPKSFRRPMTVRE